MSATLDSTPRLDGFRMPGEFELHAGCWMLWPERPDNWRVGANPAQAAFAAVAAANLALLYRENRPFRIYDGPSEVHRASIARRVFRRAKGRE